MLFDAHNHLADPRLAPHLPALWPELRRIGVACVVVNSARKEDWKAVRALAQEHPEVLPSYGLHPWFLAPHPAMCPPDCCEKLEPFLQEAMAAQRAKNAALSKPLVPVAIGEIGLDRARSGVDLPTQQAFFTRQLALAARWNLPASIHCVKAWGAMEELLRTHPVPARGVLLHAYNGPAEMLPSLLKSGAYFSFSGQHFARSFRRKSNGQTAWQEPFRRIPADRLLVETDAPDGLAGLPEAQASLANGEEPAAFHRRYATGLQTLYAVLAGLRGESPEGLEAQVAENFQRFFGAEG